MSKPLVYLDQNVLIPMAQRVPDRGSGLNVQWVYSKEHFAEIRRSSNPDQYLTALDKLDAKLIELELIDWRITGSARLVDGLTAFQNYSSYCETLTDIDINETLFDPIQAWVNGGGDDNLLRDLPGRFAKQILTLTESLPLHDRAMLRRAASEADLTPMIDQMITWGNDIHKTRVAFGDGKGRIGQIVGDNQLLQIWSLIEPGCSGMTADQFFGFDPVDKQGYKEWPVYLGILGCCAMLDILGFQGGKKCRKLDKLPNVRSDSGHIAMGAFCSAILSADKRLAKRAKAIYEYKQIRTVSVHFEAAG